MRTIIARNAHQSLPETAYQMQKFSEKGRLPIPLSTVCIKPNERVIFHPELDANPFLMFFTGLLSLTWDIGDSIRDLFTYEENLSGYYIDGVDLSTAVNDIPATLDCMESVNYHFFHIGIDVDGKLEMLVSSAERNISSMQDVTVFSFVQEYLASSVGREVGLMYHTALKPLYLGGLGELASKAPEPPEPYTDPYSEGKVTNTIPLMSTPKEQWDEELEMFAKGDQVLMYKDPFFSKVAVPLLDAYRKFKGGDAPGALQSTSECAAQDWMMACREWLERRS